MNKSQINNNYNYKIFNVREDEIFESNLIFYYNSKTDLYL